LGAFDGDALRRILKVTIKQQQLPAYNLMGGVGESKIILPPLFFIFLWIGKIKLCQLAMDS
jgi:hypothetical protein